MPKNLQGNLPPFLLEQFEDIQKKSNTTDDDLKTQDGKQKRFLRVPVAIFFAVLLTIQHAFTYSIILIAIEKNILQDLQLIFSTLIAGTLIETGFVAKTIVDWMYGKK